MEVYIVVKENYDAHQDHMILLESTNVTLFNDAFAAALEVADDNKKKANDFYTEIKKLKDGQTKVMREYMTKSLIEKYKISVTKKVIFPSKEKMLSFEIRGNDILGAFDPKYYKHQIEESDEEDDEEEEEEEDDEEGDQDRD